MTEAKAIIEKLGLVRHPEGGWFKEMFRDANGDRRAHSTAIYYLLERGDRSHWHRVDAAEVWHYYAGAPLTLSVSPNGKTRQSYRLGPDILKGDTPQVVVPPHAWQSAESSGSWTLVGCTVAPGFDFAGFEMAPEGWTPA